MAGEWGIYSQGGGLAITPDTFLGVECKNSFRVSNFPQEEGAFASYNKIATPYDIKATIAVSGFDSSKGDVLASTYEMLSGTDLYMVVTPDEVYDNATLVNYQYHRSSKHGVTLLVAELWFTEVRLVDGVSVREPSQTSSQSSSNGGTVQAQPTTQSPGDVQ